MSPTPPRGAHRWRRPGPVSSLRKKPPPDSPGAALGGDRFERRIGLRRGSAAAFREPPPVRRGRQQRRRGEPRAARRSRHLSDWLEIFEEDALRFPNRLDLEEALTESAGSVQPPGVPAKVLAE